jgi:DNA-binding MarR family transcriptional regulator
VSRTELLQDLSEALRRTHRATEAVDDAAQHALGLNRTDGRALDILDRHERMTAGELARESGLTTGAVTGVVDRLERAGYARRVPHPDDRRRTLVEITDRARALTWELFAPLAEQTGPLLEGYTDEQLQLLIDFHRLAATIQEEHAQRLRT